MVYSSYFLPIARVSNAYVCGSMSCTGMSSTAPCANQSKQVHLLNSVFHVKLAKGLLHCTYRFACIE